MARTQSGRARSVREPIQVYLDRDERSVLDRLAEETGLSRAEILRRGLRRFAAEAAGGEPPMLAFAAEVAERAFPPDVAARHDDYLAELYLPDRETDRPPGS